MCLPISSLLLKICLFFRFVSFTVLCETFEVFRAILFFKMFIKILKYFVKQVSMSIGIQKFYKHSPSYLMSAFKHTCNEYSIM